MFGLARAEGDKCIEMLFLILFFLFFVGQGFYSVHALSGVDEGGSGGDPLLYPFLVVFLSIFA